MITGIISFFLGNWQRVAVYALVIGMALGMAELDGYRRGEKKLWEYQADQARAAVAVAVRIEKVKEEVRVPYIKREIQIQKVFIEIEKEAANVPSRPNCNVTAGWMFVHNAAASPAGRDEGRVDDQTDTGITEAQALGTVQANYKSFHEVVNDLTACRGFVAGLKKATD